MTDMDAVYLILASFGLVGVIAFAVYLARSHEALKRAGRVEARAGYARALKASWLVALAGGILMAAGFLGDLAPVLWFGGALLGAGVMVLAYNAFGHLDVAGDVAEPRKAARSTKSHGGATERMVGTLAVVFGLLTFLSWGVDFLAFPAAVVTGVLVAILVVLKLRKTEA